MVALTIRLPDDLHEWLRAEAFRRRVPMARLIAYAIIEHIEAVETERKPCQSKSS